MEKEQRKRWFRDFLRVLKYQPLSWHLARWQKTCSSSYQGEEQRVFRAPGPNYFHRWGWFLAPSKGKGPEEDRLEKPQLKGLKRAYHVFEKYLPIFTSFSFVVGVIVGKIIPKFAEGVDGAVSGFVNGYSTIAPIAIYFVLTPALIKIVGMPRGTNGKRFGFFAVGFLMRQRLATCFWACLFTTIAFGLPVYTSGSITLREAFSKSISTFVMMATHSNYFYAFYASFLTVPIALKIKWIRTTITKPTDWLESGGRLLVPIIPVFMIAIGSYVSHLDVNIADQIGSMEGLTLHPIKLFGLTVAPVGYGMVWIYLMGAFATAITCWVWHLVLIGYTKVKLGSHFSLKTYFTKYLPPIYPLLWATCSESLGMPLNLNLVKKYYPEIPPEVRRFCVGGGTTLSINGTMNCVFVLAAVVCQLLGIQLSLTQLFMMLPIVFLMGYGVPGMPGELILFGGPIVALLGLPPEMAKFFIAIYVGIQIGLPDSFRSATNSTDNCVSAHLMVEVYERKYASQPAVGGGGGGLQPVMGEFGLAPTLNVRQLRAETRSVFPRDTL